MINPGEFKDKITVLELGHTDDTYAWNAKVGIWAKTEQLQGKNIFSSVGVGTKSIKFTIRKRSLTLHNAFLWKEKHCFLTDIAEIDRIGTM